MMPVTLKDVVRALLPDEANLDQAAALGVEALPHLRALVMGPDPMLAAKATYVAGLLHDGGGSEIVRVAATRPDKMVRGAAVSALQFLTAEEADTVLPGLLTDADAEIRQLAIQATAARRTPEVNRALEVLSLTDPYPYLRDLSAQALGRASESSP